MKTFHSITFFCVAGMLLAGNVSASSVLPVTFEQMKDNWTDALVRAEVLDKEVSRVTLDYLDRTGRRTESTNIYTRYALEIKDTLYGDDVGGSVSLYMLGGELEDEFLENSSAFELEPGWDIVIHLQHEEVNDIYVSAGTAHTVFLARRIEGQEVFVNLADLPNVTLDRDALSNLRTNVEVNERIRDPEEPPLLEYETLERMFAEERQ
ncbi:hypothetical protein [Wenzhouxiangella sp. EGI_FJ10409]|uniref:hypothetical protein n=1 Tax=Wenzhouxiangella sp. EGI_FJ10409 TaxID=3243767 RepID=UPI0035D88E87